MDIPTKKKRRYPVTSWGSTPALSIPSSDVVAFIRNAERLADTGRRVEQIQRSLFGSARLIVQQQFHMESVFTRYLGAISDDHFRTHLRTMEYVHSSVVLVQNRLRSYQDLVGASVRHLLIAWSDLQTEPQRLAHAVAMQVRQHILSVRGMDTKPVEDFAYRWLGLHRPARAEEREALIEAVIEALLSDDWCVDASSSYRVLRHRVRVARQSTKPPWARKINGSLIRSLDEAIPQGADGGEVALITTLTLPSGNDVEGVVLGREFDPYERYLSTVLSPTELATVLHYVDNHGQITWAQAALFVGHPAEKGENVRRKLKRYAQECRKRYPRTQAVRANAGITAS